MNNDRLRIFLKNRFDQLVNSYKLALLTYPGYNLAGIQEAYDAGYIKHNLSADNDRQLAKEAIQANLDLNDAFELAVLREQVASVAKQGLLKAAEFSHDLATFQVDEKAEREKILDSENYKEFPEALLRYQLHCLMQYRQVEKGRLGLAVAEKISSVMETGGLKDPMTEPRPLFSSWEEQTAAVKESEEKGRSVTLKELIHAYFETKNQLSERTKKAYSGTFSRLTYFLGESYDLSHFSHKTARDFEAFVSKAPANLNKNRLLKDFSKDELLQHLDKNTEFQSISPATLKNNLTRMSSLFEFGKRRGFVGANFFEGWASEVSPDRQKKDQRKRYTNDEVIRLLPNEEDRKILKNDFEQHLCHLGAYTGMRLEEICSLHIGNIEEIEGILVFNLDKNYPQQHYKNKNAKRIIPVHDALRSSGFIDFWQRKERLSPASTPLFNDLTYRQQQFSRKASRWFNERHLKNQGWKGYKGIKSNEKQRLNFHSFRHTFVSKLLEQKDAAPLHVIQFIAGHGQDSVTTRIYGSDAKRDIEDLKALVDKISYT
jgi:integrase